MLKFLQAGGFWRQWGQGKPQSGWGETPPQGFHWVRHLFIYFVPKSYVLSQSFWWQRVDALLKENSSFKVPKSPRSFLSSLSGRRAFTRKTDGKGQPASTENVTVVLTTFAGADSKQMRTGHPLYHVIYTRVSQVAEKYKGSPSLPYFFFLLSPNITNHI